METINAAAPFETAALIFSGAYDSGFAPLAPALAQVFSNGLELQGPSTGHELPRQNDATFQQTLTFIRGE